MAILIAREFATRQALGFPMDLPVKFRKGHHFVVAFPSSSVVSRQEYYHGLTVDRIYVSNARGKQRADDTMKTRAEAVRRAKGKNPLVYRVKTIDNMRGGKLPLMDGHGSHAQLPRFDRLGKEFGDGTLRKALLGEEGCAFGERVKSPENDRFDRTTYGEVLSTTVV